MEVGTNWFRSNWYQLNPKAMKITENKDGSILLAGPWTFNNQLSATFKTGNVGFKGTAFGGGGYFEATLSWSVKGSEYQI